MHYYRPLLQSDPARPRGAVAFAEGPLWFSEFEMLSHTEPALRLPAEQMPTAVLDRLMRPRSAVCGIELDRPVLMGILNVTPDSFSDGGKFTRKAEAIAHAGEMVACGADILDIGGESTRPGADYVPSGDEIARTKPIIEELQKALPTTPLSIDTRKADVAREALSAGASLFNDVTALSFDPESIEVAAEYQPFICLMHASGDPKTMQKNPTYQNVLLDVYDYLSSRLEAAIAAGVPREKIILDPGIGFGKTLQHNIQLLQGMSLFHTLGCPLLLGASRKRMIQEIAGVDNPEDRVAGSTSIALHGLSQGVQIIRAHDIAAHKQAFSMWQALVN